MTQIQLPMDRLELGRLYFKIANFETAIVNLREGMANARAERDWASWCRYLPLLLRIYAERLDFAAVQALKCELAGVREAESLPEHSGIRYTFGIADCYEMRLDSAREHFTVACALALGLSERAQAQFGLATVDLHQGRPHAAAARLRELQRDLHDSLLLDLKLATGSLLALTLRDLGQLDLALDLLGPLQVTCRAEQNLFMSLNVLYSFGTIYQRKGQVEKARHYFEMVQALTVPKDLPHMEKQVAERLRELSEMKPQFQLKADRSVITPTGQEISFGGQFILRELLKIFGARPGQTLSKEEIVRRLWKEEYNPLVHDNKIYVTIRRLRRMLEPEAPQSEYILSVRDGYQFNPQFGFKVC